MPSIRLDDFTGGLWIPGEAAPTTEQPGFEAPENALLQADNLDFLPNGAIRGRRGSEKYNASPVSGEFIGISKLYIPPNTAERRSSASLEVLGLPIDRTFFPWVNPQAGIEKVGDGEAATATHAFGFISDYLYFVPLIGVYNPVPADATITRVEVRIVRKGNQLDIVDETVQLVLVTAPTGTNKADTVTQWPVAYDTAVYGGPLDGDPLWGLALTADIVNLQSFGVAIASEATLLDSIASIDYVEMIIYFTTGLTDKFVVVHIDGSDHLYKTASGGSFSLITNGTKTASAHRPRIIAWSEKQKLFIFDGLNPLFQYDGMTISDVITGEVPAGLLFSPLTPRRGPYAALHKGQLFATEPSEIAGSVYGSEVNREDLWSPDVHLNVGDDKGGSITGIESFGDSLIILKDTCLFSFLGSALPGGQSGQLIKYSDIGCLSPDSVANTEFGVIFVGRDGVYITDGREVTPLSYPIRSLFVSRDAQTTYRDAVAVYFPRREQYWLKLDPTDFEAYVLHRVTVPTEGGTSQVLAWSKINDCLMNVGFALPGAPDNGDLYLGDLDGFLWLRDVGSTDEGSDYTTQLRTKQRMFDPEGRREGRVSQIRALARTAAPFDVTIWFDQSDNPSSAYTLGEVTADPEYQEPRYFIDTFDRFARFVSAEVEGSGGPAFELTRLDLDFMLRTRRVWR